MCRSRKVMFEVILAGLTGVGFLAIAVLSLIDIVRGDYRISAHFCERYGYELHFSSLTFDRLGACLVCATVSIWVAISMWRKKRSI